VALDLTQVDNQNLGSGQFRYAVDLVNGLCAADDDVEMTLLGSTPRPAAELRNAVQSARCRYVELARYRGRGYYYYDIARLSWWLITHRVHVFHQLHTNIPPVAPCPVVVTAYHFYDDPALFATRPYRYYRWALGHRADMVIAISDATRDEFHARFKIPLARMRTIHPGLSKSFGSVYRAPGSRPYLLSPYNLSGPKNLSSLILAWPAIADRHPAADLILYGRAHLTPDNEAAFEQLLARTAHADRIRRVGHVTDSELAGLYEACALFVFPTTVEGFGYPLLEAMAHGACCITRDASAMKELGGDAVRLVETLRPEEIAAAAIELLHDPVRRSTMGQRARRRAAQFTVDAMVRNTLDLYRAVAGARAPGHASGPVAGT
jgi:glycosyltransferase involved in cell wall biosynthesis